MISICGENKIDYKTLEFGETLEIYKVSPNHILELQVYYDENGDSVYNISIEENDDTGLLSITTDYFETRMLKEARAFFESLRNMLKQTKGDH